MDGDTTGPASPHREQSWCQNNLKVVKSILQKFYCIGLLSAHYMQFFVANFAVGFVLPASFLIWGTILSLELLEKFLNFTANFMKPWAI